MQTLGLWENNSADNFLPFHYLNKAGAGPCSLCMPAISNNLDWNSKQVASLYKVGDTCIS